jgi:hypothetical protein
VINIQSTLQTAPDLSKNISFIVLFGSNRNPYADSMWLNTCMYMHIRYNTERLVEQNK